MIYEDTAYYINTLLHIHGYIYIHSYTHRQAYPCRACGQPRQGLGRSRGAGWWCLPPGGRSDDLYKLSITYMLAYSVVYV